MYWVIQCRRKSTDDRWQSYFFTPDENVAKQEEQTLSKAFTEFDWRMQELPAPGAGAKPGNPAVDSPKA